jgi:hypothetical protein
MNKSFRQLLRDLHLYVGLFLSPFVLVFAGSVIFLVHSWVPGGGAPARTWDETNLSLPAGFEQLKGREQVDAAHTLLDRIGIRGEIWNIRQFPKERRFEITVNVPGSETIVNLKVDTRSATIAQRNTGMADALIYLHKLPGPHLEAIRGNSFVIDIWRWMADATVHMLLFMSISGVYLWAVLRAERRVGLILLAAGTLSFGGIVYALVS